MKCKAICIHQRKRVWNPERIREIFADELKNYVDDDAYAEYAKSTFLWRIIRKEVDEYMDGIVNDVFSKLEDKVEVQQPNMMEYVRQGEIAIPFDEICLINADVQSYVKKYFE